MSKRSCAAAESIEDASLRMARVNGRRMQKRSVRIALRRKGRMSLSQPDGAYCFLHRAVPFSLQCALRMIKCKERDYRREVFYMNKRYLSMTAVFTAAALLLAPISGIEAQAAPAAAAQAAYVSELTGLPTSIALQTQRPVAVMIDNDTKALPHYGLSEADVVYEMMNSTANKRVTRLMAIYKDWQNVGQIGNVRSTRPTNILLASEWNAILIHDGGPFYNNPYFKSTGISHLSGGFSRVKNGKAQEFTEYVLKNDIAKQVTTAAIPSTYTNPAAMNHWKIGATNLSAKAGNIPANLVQLNCFRLTKPYLSYNAKTGTYDYYENKKLAKDGEDKKAPSFANVILQNCTFTQYDKNGYLIYNVIGQGAGWYITGGKAIPIMWAKASETGITHYYDLSGAEITLNPGKTYIGICPSDDWTSVTVS